MDRKKVVLISFYDSTCESTRLLSSILKNRGHETFLIFFKDDRAAVIDEFKKNNKYYQIIVGTDFCGSGEDINPPTENDVNLLIENVKGLQPDIIGFSARTVAKELCKKLTFRLRNVLSNCRYIGGGYGPTLEPEYFLDFLDYVCLGEGNRAILDLVELNDPCSCDNICTLEGTKLRYNSLSNACFLDESPFPDWNNKNKFMIEEDNIFPIEEFYDTKTYNISASIGCPSSCTYCQACQLGKIYEMYGTAFRKIRLRSPQNVIEELLMAKNEYNIETVRFMDSVFGFNKTWFNEFMDIYDNLIRLEFMCFLDERWVDPKMIKRLKTSGLQRSVVGIQSTTEKIRNEVMGRNVKDESIIRFAEMLNEYNIPFKYDIIHWNPFDTRESLYQGINLLRQLPKGNQTDIFQLKVYPRSDLDKRIKEEEPSYLSDLEYEYWAWIYQLILRSDETEEIADFAMKYSSFERSPYILRELLIEVSSRSRSKYKLCAARDLVENERITGVKLARKKLDLEEAIDHDKINALIGKFVCKRIPKGDPIKRDDVYGSYEEKLPFV